MLHILCAIFNSSITSFQLAFAGSTWGLERPTVEPNDLLSLRVPDLKLSERHALEAVVAAEKAAAKSQTRERAGRVKGATIPMPRERRSEGDPRRLA